MKTIINNIDILPLDDGLQRPGIICAANESRFSAVFFSEPLTAFTVGWKDPENLKALLDFIAPAVMVGRRFEFKKALNSEAFLSETDDVRAIGAAFKRVEYAGESVNEKTLNKGLTIRVDHDEEVGEDWQERFVQLLLQRLYRNEVRRAITALDSADTNQNKVWDSTSNPDADVRSALSTATSASGVRPNRVLYGESAWDLRADAYDAQNNAGAYRSAGLTPDELARKLFIDGSRVVSARYQATTSSKNAVLGNQVFMYYALEGQMKDEPSNIKRFVTPSDNGGAFRVFIQEHSKFTDLTVEHYSNVVITSDLAIRKITASAS